MKKKVDLKEKKKEVQTNFEPEVLKMKEKGKKKKQDELDGMPPKDELYIAGEDLYAARKNLSHAHEQNKQASENFITVAKEKGLSSITIVPDDDAPRTFKVNHKKATTTVAMIKEK